MIFHSISWDFHWLEHEINYIVLNLQRLSTILRWQRLCRKTIFQNYLFTKWSYLLNCHFDYCKDIISLVLYSKMNLKDIKNYDILRIRVKQQDVKSINAVSTSVWFVTSFKFLFIIFQKTFDKIIVKHVTVCCLWNST